MQKVSNDQEGSFSHAQERPRQHSVSRAAASLGLIASGVFYLMLAMGGASFVHECNTVVCGQLHQAVFAAIGALALFVAAYRVYLGESSAALIIFLGTVPILVVHILLVMTDPNESMFFPVSTSVLPVLSGAVLLYGVGLRRQRVPA